MAENIPTENMSYNKKYILKSYKYVVKLYEMELVLFCILNILRVVKYEPVCLISHVFEAHVHVY